MDNKELPPELRFLLLWCPLLTPDEACDAATIGAVLRQRSRQGLLRDWLCALLPSVGLSAIRRRMNVGPLLTPGGRGD